MADAAVTALLEMRGDGFDEAEGTTGAAAARVCGPQCRDAPPPGLCRGSGSPRCSDPTGYSQRTAMIPADEECQTKKADVDKCVYGV